MPDPAAKDQPVDPAPSAVGATLKVLVGAAVGAGCGYVVTALAARTLGPVGYQPFGAFWSALYLVVAALSGYQQEITRACKPTVGQQSSRNVMRQFFGLNTALVAATIAIVSVFLAPQITPDSSLEIALSLIVGSTGYLFVAILSGMLFGLGLIAQAALLTAGDGVIRLVAYLATSRTTTSLTALSMSVAVPFAIAAGLVWLISRTSISGRYQIDVPSYQLTRQSLQVVLGTAASGVVLSGIPLILGVVSTSRTQAEIGSLTLLIILTRSPIVLPLMAVQSLLITHFRKLDWPLISALRITAITVLAGFTLSGVAALLGPALVRNLISPSFAATSGTVAVLVLASVALAVLCVSGPAALSVGLHRAYSLGWVVAAIVTVGGILLPLESMTTRTVVGMACGPLAGALVHFAALLRLPRVSGQS